MHLTNDSPSFTPVHSQIRAIGPRVLHLAMGRGQSMDQIQEDKDHLIILNCLLCSGQRVCFIGESL